MGDYFKMSDDCCFCEMNGVEHTPKIEGSKYKKGTVIGILQNYDEQRIILDEDADEDLIDEMNDYYKGHCKLDVDDFLDELEEKGVKFTLLPAQTDFDLYI